MKKIILIFMAYSIELALSILIVILSFFTLERHGNVVVFIMSKSDLLIGGIIAILCAKIAVYIYHMTITATDFGNYLSYVKADTVYKNSYIYSIGIDVICIMTLIWWAVTKETIPFRLSVFLCSMTLITLFTTLQNIFEVVKLNNIFNRKISEFSNHKKH